jgi:hypothetical protein
MSAAVDFTYLYPFPSELKRKQRGADLSLATCSASHEHPVFFEGAIRQPRVVADMLLVLTEVVRTHFFLPRPPIMDPVLTSSESMLRLEGFSGCCGVYARVDLPPDAFDGDVLGRGTTNVDFNNPMRNALARVRDTDEVRLAVGRDEVTLTKGDEQVVEKKVKLPLRWIKGFSEVQAYQPSLSIRHEVPAANARRFIQGLPRTGAPKQPTFVVATGSTLRSSQREKPGAVMLRGTHRIRILEPLLTKAKQLRVWADDSSETSAWEVEFDSGRFFLMLSPEVYRGFSGEGQVLETLAHGHGEEILARVRAQLTWQTQIDPAAVAGQLGVDATEINGALARLGSRGLAGYDVTAGRYFHRELPFDLSQVEALQPRLKGARKLLDEKKVSVAKQIGVDEWDLAVIGSGVTHHVRVRNDGDRCTCPWFSKHQGDRGPCKHILASQLFVDNIDRQLGERDSDAGQTSRADSRQ